MSKNNSFVLEKTRQVLAAKNKLPELKKLYESSVPEIKNLNTSKFWDERNRWKPNDIIIKAKSI
jgi:hypothetical protein